MKIVIVVVFAIILYCLGSAAYYLVKGDASERFAWALTWRIGLSMALFLLLMFSAWMGWVHPHALGQ